MGFLSMPNVPAPYPGSSILLDSMKGLVHPDGLHAGFRCDLQEKQRCEGIASSSC